MGGGRMTRTITLAAAGAGLLGSAAAHADPVSIATWAATAFLSAAPGAGIAVAGIVGWTAAVAGRDQGRRLRAAVANDCLAYRDVVCRSCGDACGEAAIRFSPRLGGAARPEILAERCTGCGACVSACPAGAVTMATAGD